MHLNATFFWRTAVTRVRIPVGAYSFSATLMQNLHLKSVSSVSTHIYILAIKYEYGRENSDT
jgi:hypothetical protein